MNSNTGWLITDSQKARAAREDRRAAVLVQDAADEKVLENWLANATPAELAEMERG